MRPYLIAFLLAWMTCAPLYAVSMEPVKAKADSAYADKLYLQAVQLYAEVLAEAPSSETYYNLGNAQFRLHNLPQAILAYERALHLDPGHEDARFNLELVRTRLTDRFGQPQRMFFVAWMSDFVASHSAAAWLHASTLFLLLFALCFALYRSHIVLWLRKLSFAMAMVAILCFVLSVALAFVQRAAYDNNTRAVVIKDQVQSYASPTTTSQRLITLHEGTTVDILSSGTPAWWQVSLPDGTQVWIAREGVERVVSENTSK